MLNIVLVHFIRVKGNVGMLMEDTPPRFTNYQYNTQYSTKTILYCKKYNIAFYKSASSHRCNLVDNNEEISHVSILHPVKRGFSFCFLSLHHLNSR